MVSILTQNFTHQIIFPFDFLLYECNEHNLFFKQHLRRKKEKIRKHLTKRNLLTPSHSNKDSC